MSSVLLLLSVPIIFLILYQIYYYLLGGKEKSLTIELTDIPKIFKDLVQEGKINNQRTKQELDTAIANGTAYILPPKYFFIPEWLRVFLIICVVLFLMYVIDFSFSYIANLTETCQKIYGINVLLFKELLIILIFICFLLSLACTDIIGFFKKNKQKTSYLFSERIIFNNDKEDKAQIDWGTYSIYSALTVLFLFTMQPDVKDALRRFDIAEANHIYEQRCKAKEKPSD